MATRSDKQGFWWWAGVIYRANTEVNRSYSYNNPNRHPVVPAAGVQRHETLDLRTRLCRRLDEVKAEVSTAGRVYTLYFSRATTFCWIASLAPGPLRRGPGAPAQEHCLSPDCLARRRPLSAVERHERNTGSLRSVPFVCQCVDFRR